MTLASRLLTASGGGVDKLFVDDVFQAFTRTGTGASATITTGINLSVKGGLIWSKGRSGATDHKLTDTARGVTNALVSNTTAAQTADTTGITAVSTTGHTVGANATYNTNGATYVDWVFAKAPKFFDVVTYTGNGVAGRQIPHALGIAPGMIIVKRTSGISDWVTVARQNTNSYAFFPGINLTAGATNGTNITAESDGALTAAIFDPSYISNSSAPGNTTNFNDSGESYVAYLFAHDSSADGIIQCGSFTTDGSATATVNHGWSAGIKFAAIKASSTTGDWEMYDAARTAAWSGSDARLRANLSNAEDSVGRLSASGTSVSFAGLSASATYVYLFIVAPT